MWSDVLEQLHNSVCPCKHDLDLAAGTRGVELGAFLLKCVQSEKAEQLHEDFKKVLVNLALLLNLLERREVSLDDHILSVSLAEAVEVNEKVVPRLLLLITVLAGLEGKERDAPSEGSDKILI